jgi:hypothetical protein
VQRDLEQGCPKRRFVGAGKRCSIHREFSQVDTNNDGSLDKKEFDAACAKGMMKNPQ